MKTKIENKLSVFFKASSEMDTRLAQQDDSKFPASEKEFWQEHISTTHLRLIFQWIANNGESITKDILKSQDLAVFYAPEVTGEIPKKGDRYLGVEIVVDQEVHLFFHTNSNLPNSKNNKRLKEQPLTTEELKAGVRKKKEISRGTYKTVKYCAHWTPTMLKLEIFTAAVVSSGSEIKNLDKEIKFARMIGEPAAHVGISGSTRIGKGGKKKRTLYSALAQGDQMDWVEGKKMTPPGQMNPEHFLLVLYTQMLGLAILEKKGIIWRDLKVENYLMVNTMIKIVNQKGEEVERLVPLPRMIDFSFSSLSSDSPQELFNDKGSRIWISPWSELYRDLRRDKRDMLNASKEMKIIEIEYSKIQPNSLTPQLFETLKKEYNTFNQVFVNCSDSFEQEATTLEKNGSVEAVSAIREVCEVKDLCGPNGSTQMLASTRDDIWPFCKLMINLISTVWIQNSGSQSDLVLEELYEFFSKNLKASWRTLATAAQILQKMEEIINKYFPKTESELPLLAIGVTKLFNESQADHKKEPTRSKSPISEIFKLNQKILPPPRSIVLGA